MISTCLVCEDDFLLTILHVLVSFVFSCFTFLFVFPLLQLLVPRLLVSVMLSVCLLITLPECVSVLMSVRTSAALCAAVMERLILMTVILKLLHVSGKQMCLFATLESAVSGGFFSH